MAKSISASRPAIPFWAIPAYRQALFFVLKAAVIIEGGAWALSPVLKGTWYGDDTLYLTMNPLLYDPDRLWKAWFQPGSFIDYYPLEQTVQWFQWKLWGLDTPFPYLVSNLVLHLTSALLVWHLLSKLGLKLAWLAGLICALHPLMVDSVGVSCELKNTLSLPPFLLAMCFYLDFEKRGERQPYLLALLMFLVAMLCKITMAFFPGVILLYAWWKRGRVTWTDGQAALPFFAISLILGVIFLHSGAVYAAATHYQSPGPIHLGGLFERLALAGLSLAFYLGHSFLPLHPMPLYPLWKLEPLTPSLFVPWLGIVVVLAVGYWKRKMWGRPVLFALGFFVLALAPFLGLNEVSYMCLTWVQDHFLYIPIIALIGLVAGLEHAAAQISKKILPAAIAVVTLVLMLLGFQTHSYATIFADHEQLWRYNLAYNPNTWFARYLYGDELAKRDDNEEAIEQLQESLRVNPVFDNAYFELGTSLCKVGNFSAAVDAFESCLRVNPRYGAAHLYLGIALSRTGRVNEAIAEFHTLLKIAPNSPDGHVGWPRSWLKPIGFRRRSRKWRRRVNSIPRMMRSISSSNSLKRLSQIRRAINNVAEESIRSRGILHPKSSCGILA
jgi:tetratricopeptide (TPR) repeat protein